jgi:hypothetical protein
MHDDFDPVDSLDVTKFMDRENVGWSNPRKRNRNRSQQWISDGWIVTISLTLSVLILVGITS